MGILGFTPVWRQICSKAFLSNCNKSNIPSTQCPSSRPCPASLPLRLLAHYPFPFHPQPRCLLTLFPPSMVSYFLTPLILILILRSSSSTAVPPFSNIILPAFISTSLLPSLAQIYFLPQSFLLTTFHQFPALANSVPRTGKPEPPQHCSSPGLHCRKNSAQPSVGK